MCKAIGLFHISIGLQKDFGISTLSTGSLLSRNYDLSRLIFQDGNLFQHHLLNPSQLGQILHFLRPISPTPNFNPPEPPSRIKILQPPQGNLNRPTPSPPLPKTALLRPRSASPPRQASSTPSPPPKTPLEPLHPTHPPRRRPPHRLRPMPSRQGHLLETPRGHSLVR